MCAVQDKTTCVFPDVAVRPVGATGVKQILEVYRQMKGQCGDYQMSTAPTHGITANMGGDDKTSVVGIFKNC